MIALNRIALFSLFVLSSCASKETKSTLAGDLVGEWRNVYLNVTMPTVGNSDSTATTVCDSANWEAMLHIKPIHTFFNKDGTYRSEYYTLSDSLFRKTAGTWHVSNDTLVMNESGGVTKSSTPPLKTTWPSLTVCLILTPTEKRTIIMWDVNGNSDIRKINGLLKEAVRSISTWLMTC